MAGGRPRKLPPRDEVVNLYAGGMSTLEIAEMFGVSDPHTVRTQLLRAGVKLRRHTVKTICRIEGCNEAAKKIRHTNNGALYGTLCEAHRTIHYARLNREIKRRNRGISEDRYRPCQINELKPEGWKWITKSKKILREMRGLLADPSALNLRSEASAQEKTSRHS